MRKLITVAIAVMVLTLAGVAGADTKTKEGWPACLATGGLNTFMGFMSAILEEDEFAIQFFRSQKSCGPLLGGMRAEVLERGDHIFRIRVYPPAPHEPAVLITVPEAVE